MFGLVINLTILGLVASSPLFSFKPADDGDDPRIVDGKEIDIAEAPYQVSLVEQGLFICGGSIVGENLILTSAHCFFSKDPKKYQIRAGSSSHKEGGVLHEVQEIVIHPKYNPRKYTNDLAVLKLAKPVELSEKVKPIELIEAGKEFNGGEPVQVSGWGRVSEDGPISTILKMVTLPVVDHKACREQYTSVVTVTPEMECAGEAGKAACKGDSGGPMVYNNKLAGVVAWSKGCARPGNPTVFMRVSSYRTWLDKTLAKLKADADVRPRFFKWVWDWLFNKEENNEASTPTSDEKNQKNDVLTLPSDEKNQENDVSTPPSDEKNQENDVSTPPSDEKNQENDVSTPPSDEKNQENDVSTPPSDEKNQENDVSTPPYDEKNQENDVSTPPSDENDQGNDVSIPPSDEKDQENDVSVPAVDA